MVNPVSKEEITFDHILAAEFIQKAFRRFLEFRRVDGEIGKPGTGTHRPNHADLASGGEVVTDGKLPNFRNNQGCRVRE